MLDANGASAARGFAMARAAEAMLRAVGATNVHVIRVSQKTGTLQERQLGQVTVRLDRDRSQHLLEMPGQPNHPIVIEQRRAVLHPAHQARAGHADRDRQVELDRQRHRIRRLDDSIPTVIGDVAEQDLEQGGP